jgi:hypothetical protein
MLCSIAGARPCAKVQPATITWRMRILAKLQYTFEKRRRQAMGKTWPGWIEEITPSLGKERSNK